MKTLEKQLTKLSLLRIESFALMLEKSRENPINIYAIRELSDTHSNYCSEYKSTLLNYD